MGGGRGEAGRGEREKESLMLLLALQAGGLRPPSRRVKTSPALFSLDRVMQSFRARSQLLVSRLEDMDEVLHQTFSDDSGDELLQEEV